MRRHLSPFALLFLAYENIREYIWLLFPIATLVQTLPWKNTLLLTIISEAIMIVLLSLKSYCFFTYEINSHEIIIRKGLLIKHKQHLAFNRIQTIHTEQYFFMKPFNVTKVILETANFDKTGRIILKAVNIKEANSLKKYLEKVNAQVDFEPTGFRLNSTDQLIYTLTSAGCITVAFVLIGIWERITDFGIRLNYSLPLLIGIILIGFWLMYFIAWQKMYQFHIYHEGRVLKSASGLLSKTEITIPIKRIQGIIFEANFIRYLCHYVSIQAIASAKSTDEEAGNLNLIPLVKKERAKAALSQLLPQWPIHFSQPTYLNKKGKRTYLIYKFNWSIVILCLLNLGVIYYLPAFLWLAMWISVIFVLYQIFISFIYLKVACVSFNQTALSLTTKRYFKVIEASLPREKIQYLELKQSYFMKRNKLMHLELEVMDKHSGYQIRLRYLPETCAKSIQNWYMKNK